MNARLCKRLYGAFAILSCVGSLIIMGLSARPDDLSALLGLLPFALWVIGPHWLGSLIGWLFIRQRRMFVAKAYLLLLTLSLLSGWAIYLKVRFHDPPDAQSALIFLSAPAVQWGVTLLAALPAIIVGLIRR